MLPCKIRCCTSGFTWGCFFGRKRKNWGAIFHKLETQYPGLACLLGDSTDGSRRLVVKRNHTIRRNGISEFDHQFFGSRICRSRSTQRRSLESDNHHIRGPLSCHCPADDRLFHQSWGTEFFRNTKYSFVYPYRISYGCVVNA